jgi:hypothetical protein
MADFEGQLLTFFPLRWTHLWKRSFKKTHQRRRLVLYGIDTIDKYCSWAFVVRPFRCLTDLFRLLLVTHSQLHGSIASSGGTHMTCPIYLDPPQPDHRSRECLLWFERSGSEAEASSRWKVPNQSLSNAYAPVVIQPFWTPENRTNIVGPRNR